MADKKILNNISTDITIVQNNIDIYTYYKGKFKKIIAFITNTIKSINGISFKENELGLIIENYDDTDFYINKKGELIVYSDIAEDFSIDESGMLTIYEEEDQ